MSLQGTGPTGISNYLKNTLIASVPSLRASNIFDYEEADLAGFPAATISLQEKKGKTLDNNRNEHIFSFTIRVFIERTKQNFGASKAESILRSVVSDLITKIDADPTLGNNCIVCNVQTQKYGYVDRANQDIRLCEVTLDCIDANTWR